MQGALAFQLRLTFTPSEDLREIHEEPHLAIAPAIDGLLGIAYQQCAAAGAQRIVDQRQQAGPLQQRGVLELVDEEVPVAFAHPLVDEGHGFFLHHGRHFASEVAEEGDRVRLF